MDERETNKSSSGPRIERSGKETRKFGKRIIFVFLFGLAGLILGINAQVRFKSGDFSDIGAAKNYRIPPASGFAELAASMRSDRKTAPVDKPEPPSADVRTQRIVIEGGREPRTLPVRPAMPRYRSDNDDAQLARTLRNMKVQAITAKPVVENFKASGSDAERAPSQGESGLAGQGRVAAASPAPDPSAMAALIQQGQSQDPNGQAGKGNFLRGADGGGSLTPQGYSSHLPVPQQFPYELKAGTLIPGILITGINSDLPGNVLAQVSENVWDTAIGRHVLIPKGTRILGVYDSRVMFGQRRVLLVWNRLIFPNGTTLDISGSPGIDQAGYSGLSGKVNEHWGTMLKTALFASVFVAGAEIIYDRDSSGSGENKSPSDAAAESLAGSILDMGTKMMNRAAGIQPTITVRPGKRMGIFVQRDVVFPFPYEL
ncbi:MAG: TrbI/VirB10 family protein [Synergistaceae bacterium]|jgi:type IV secretion system protein VirB10|nr:TrbI/VirB10 family protein [Synergistaceae bacterium]